MIVKHLSVRGWFRLNLMVMQKNIPEFQSPRGEGVLQTAALFIFSPGEILFQSPRGEGVVQTHRSRSILLALIFWDVSIISR